MKEQFSNNVKFMFLGAVVAVFVILGLSFFGKEKIVDEGKETGEIIEQTELFTCSMHPQIKLASKGKCPICFMDLIPLKIREGDNDSSIELSETAVKIASIRTVAVERKFVQKEIKLFGKIAYDETRLFDIASRVSGRIDRLFVDYVGGSVREGDHLAELYSPDLLSAQQEYLQAVDSIVDEESTDSTIMLKNSSDVVRYSREKLRLLGITETQIKELEEAGVASDHMNIYSPVNGIVINKYVKQGVYINAGKNIYTVADLRNVWLKLDAYEADISFLRYGQTVKFTVESYPGEIFEGKISFIAPFLDNETRTIKVRVNVKNEEKKLKPGMFARAKVYVSISEQGVVSDRADLPKWVCPMHPEVTADTEKNCEICGMPLEELDALDIVDFPESKPTPPLIIPVTSALLTGDRVIVYVKANKDKPVFEGREITIGSRAKDYYVVKKGLVEGEEVVVNGNFKIDSALQIEAKKSMMNLPDQEEKVNESDKEQSEDLKKKIKNLFVVYFKMQSALAGDDLIAANDAILLFKTTFDKINESITPDKRYYFFWQDISEKISKALATLPDNPILSDIRIPFFKDLSEIFYLISESTGALDEIYFQMSCPMAENGKGAYWLQNHNDLQNPYYGKMMLKCGEMKKEIKQKK